MKKIIALVLTLLMLVSLVPVSAFAIDAAPAPTIDSVLTDIDNAESAVDTAQGKADDVYKPADTTQGTAASGSVLAANEAVGNAAAPISDAQSAIGTVSQTISNTSTSVNALTDSQKTAVNDALAEVTASGTALSGVLGSDAVKKVGDVANSTEDVPGYLGEVDDIATIKTQLDSANESLNSAETLLKSVKTIDTQVSASAAAVVKQVGDVQTQVGTAADTVDAASKAANSAAEAVANAKDEAATEAAANEAAAAYVAAAAAVVDAQGAKDAADKAVTDAAKAYNDALDKLAEIKATLGIDTRKDANGDASAKKSADQLLQDAINYADAAKTIADAAQSNAKAAQDLLDSAKKAFDDLDKAVKESDSMSAAAKYVDVAGKAEEAAEAQLSKVNLVTGACAQKTGKEYAEVPASFAETDTFFIYANDKVNSFPGVYVVSATEDGNYTVNRAYQKLTTATQRSDWKYFALSPDTVHGAESDMESVSYSGGKFYLGTKNQGKQLTLISEGANAGLWAYTSSENTTYYTVYSTPGKSQEKFSFDTSDYKAKVDDVVTAVTAVKTAVAGSNTENNDDLKTAANDGAAAKYEAAYQAVLAAQEKVAATQQAAKAAADAAQAALDAANTARENYLKLDYLGSSLETLDQAKKDAAEAQTAAKDALEKAEQAKAVAKKAKEEADAALDKYREVADTVTNDPAAIAEQLLGDAYAATGAPLTVEGFANYVFAKIGKSLDLSGASVDELVAANGTKLEKLQRGALVIVLNDDGSVAGFGIAISATQFIMFNAQTGKPEIFNADGLSIVAVRPAK